MALLFLIICGLLAWGLLLGDILSNCEELFKKRGTLGGKTARLSFRTMLVSAFIVRMLLGAAMLPSAIIYKLIMRQQFRLIFFLPKEFWTKYYSDDEQPK